MISMWDMALAVSQGRARWPNRLAIWTHGSPREGDGDLTRASTNLGTCPRRKGDSSERVPSAADAASPPTRFVAAYSQAEFRTCGFTHGDRSIAPCDPRPRAAAPVPLAVWHAEWSRQQHSNIGANGGEYVFAAGPAADERADRRGARQRDASGPHEIAGAGTGRLA